MKPGRLNITSTGTPYWWDAAPPDKNTDGELPRTADVVIIGAGWTGLSAALTLARGGREVLVLEANAPGSGASTRNAGYFGSYLRATLSTLIDRFGKSVALDLTRSAQQAFAFSKKLIESEQIQCDLQDLGRLTCAYRAADYESMSRETALVQQMLGVDWHMLSAAELRQELGTDQYYGAQLKPSSFAMHPGKYLAGLVKRCRSAGVTILGDTTVSHLQKADKRMATNRGTITARDVLVATNAYTGDFIPELKCRMIPTGANLIVTEALDQELMRSVFPRARLGIDTRRIYRGFRPTPDGKRILFAGRSADPSKGATINGELLRTQMVGLFPTLEKTSISHSWGGYVSFTFDYLPHLGEIEGIYYAMGFNAAGASMAPYLGNQIALTMLGQRDKDSLLDQFEFQSRPFYRGEPWFLPMVLAVYRLLDRLGR